MIASINQDITNIIYQNKSQVSTKSDNLDENNRLLHQHSTVNSGNSNDMCNQINNINNIKSDLTSENVNNINGHYKNSNNEMKNCGAHLCGQNQQEQKSEDLTILEGCKNSKAERNCICHKFQSKVRCGICNRTYANKSSLSAHFNIHLKRFQCPLCEICCNCNSQLQKHMLTHTKQCNLNENQI